MTRYVIYNGNGTLLTYGFDAPTGGYFWTVTKQNDELIDEGNGLTLTELCSFVAGELPLQGLVDDFFFSEKPTLLQINVGTLFNRDIIALLKAVETDLKENFVKFLPI